MADGGTPLRSSLSQKSIPSQRSLSSIQDPETEESIEKIFEGPSKFYLPDTSVECSPQHFHYDEKDYKSHRNVNLHVHHPLSPISRKESKSSLRSRPSSSSNINGSPSATKLKQISSKSSDVADGGGRSTPGLLVTDIDEEPDAGQKKLPIFTIGDYEDDEVHPPEIQVHQAEEDSSEVHQPEEESGEVHQSGEESAAVDQPQEESAEEKRRKEHHQRHHHHHHHKDKGHHKHHHHHHHHHSSRRLTPQDLDARIRKGSVVNIGIGEGLRRVATEPDEAQFLKGVDLDDIASHRLGDMSGLAQHKTRKRVDSIIHVARSRHSSGASSERGSISSVLSDKPKKSKKDKRFRKSSKTKKVYDHRPHEVFVELDELYKDEGHELAWQEKARWIKFEEDVEEGTHRWGKPHVASLKFHSLVELRKRLEHGSVLLDLEETDLSNIFHRIVDNMITSDQVPEQHQGEVLRSLLIKHKHVHEKHGLLRNMSTISMGSLTGHHGTPKQSQSEVNFKQYKEKHGIIDSESSSSLLRPDSDKTLHPGGKDRKLSVHFENGSKENEEVKIPMLEVDPTIRKSASDSGPSVSGYKPSVDIEAQPLSPDRRNVSAPAAPSQLLTVPDQHKSALRRHGRISAPAMPFSRRSARGLERATSVESSKLEGIMRKIPPDAEATTVLVGELDCLNSPALCFVRLAEGTLLDGLTEVPIPVRFLFVLLGPGGIKVDYHELGRCFSTLMSSEHFHEIAYKADSMQDMLRAMNDFIDDSIVLPAGNWDKDLLLPILRQQNKKMKERQLREDAIREEEEGLPLLEEEEIDGAVAVVKPKVKAKFVNPLVRTGRVFGGLINDVKRRYPHYLSDFTDAFNAQCLAAVFFIFFAALSPAITFGGLLGEKTDNWIGISEMILGTSICGVVFALFSGQPLTIIGVTGPILVFEENLYSFCNSSGIEYLPFRFWVGLWIFIIAGICVAAEGSVLVRFFTRFTEEVFAFLISLIFIYEVFNKLRKIYVTHPLIIDYCEDLDMKEALNANVTAYYQTGITTGDYTETEGATTMLMTTIFQNETEKCHLKEPPPTNQPNTALFSTILMLGTFLLAYMFKLFRNSKFLGKHARKMIGDFGIPIAIFIMVILDIAVTTVYTQKLDVPNGLVPTDQCKRGWIVNPLGMAKPMQVYWMFAAVLPALLAFILMFMETLITGLIVNKKENKLVKGSGFHLDLLLIGGLACFNSILGLPWVWAATVRSVTHTGALTVFSKTHAPGEKPKLVQVYEQRVTAFLVNLIIGLSIALSPLLKQVPLAVLFGVFLYMGVSSLNGIQMVERCELLFMPVKHHPDVSFVRGLRTWRMHLFTIIQLGCVAILWVVKITPAALAFPFFLILLVPLRKQAMSRIFTQKELNALDSSEAGDAAKDEDEYQEAHMPV